MPAVAARSAPDTDGRSTRWDAHNAQRRKDLLDAAIAAIETHGPDVGVQQIAHTMGVPRPVVYRHFKDRRDLDEQIRQRIVEALMADLAPALTPDGTAPETIRRALDTYLGWIARHPRLHHFLGTGSRRTPQRGSRVVTGTKTAIAVQISGLIGTWLRAVDQDTALAEPLGFGLVGFTDASVNRWLSHPESALPADEFAAFLTTSIWHIVDGHARSLGLEIAPDAPVSRLLGGVRAR